jgi:hypothetical protein
MTEQRGTVCRDSHVKVRQLDTFIKIDRDKFTSRSIVSRAVCYQMDGVRLSEYEDCRQLTFSFKRAAVGSAARRR